MHSHTNVKFLKGIFRVVSSINVLKHHDRYIYHLLYFTYLLTYRLFTSWCKVLLEKITGSQLVKKYPDFMKPEVSLPRLQVPAICP